jgi:nucleoid DNA-binding protein
MAQKNDGSVKPVKDALSRSDLAKYVSEQSGVSLKETKAVLAALEGAMLGSVHKKGARTFTMPGLLKVTAQAVPAKPARMGKDPFTGQERMFAAKPASVKIKVRALKKLKDAGRSVQASAIDHPLGALGVAGSVDGDRSRGGLDLAEVVRRELDRRRVQVLLQAVRLRGPRDRHDPRLAREHPG